MDSCLTSSRANICRYAVMGLDDPKEERAPLSAQGPGLVG